MICAGVGAMTWSPLACGIISGKYDSGVPPYSRASLKVFLGYVLWSVLAVVGGVLHWWHCVCVLNEGLAWVLVCILGYCFYHFIGLWSAPAHLHMCVDECTNTFVFLLFSLLWYSGFPYISLHTAIECFWFLKGFIYCILHCMLKNTYRCK